MIDHIGIDVSDYEESKSFYSQTLAALGYELVGEYGEWAGFGIEGAPDFWIHSGEKTSPLVHVAFRSKDRAGVQAFYEAALEAGGTDNGAPGVREIYHPHYYAAFITDPDGHNIEAVCHTPEN